MNKIILTDVANVDKGQAISYLRRHINYRTINTVTTDGTIAASTYTAPVCEAATICPRPLQVDHLILKVVFESRGLSLCQS